MPTKQVIVWRQDLQNVPKGKFGAQMGHAAHLFLTEQVRAEYGGKGPKLRAGESGRVEIRLTQAEMDWILGNYRKVVAWVRSEEDLMTVYNKAKELGLPVHLVTDDGLTVFDKPTKTCISIGPAEESEVDKVTGEAGPLGKLKLL
jgi:PTH2 family peptidyl-tRNA hydrolase